MRRIYTTLILTFLLAAAAGAQTDTPWQRLTSKKKDFSISVPPGFIVHNDDRKLHILASAGNARFEITRRESRGGIGLAPISNDRNPDSKTEAFGLGDFVGRWTTYDRGGRSTTVINAASPKHSISLIAHSKTSDDKDVSRLMASIILDGQALFTIKGVNAPAASGSAVMDDLESSPIVKEYLKKPVNKDVVVNYIAFGRDTPPQVDAPVAAPVVGEPNITRPLMVLRKPVASYTVSARQDRISGSVRVKVTFLANGLIGIITADPTLDMSLAKRAVAAARNIKFIPAEVDGKPVDVTRLLVYSFAVY